MKRIAARFVYPLDSYDPVYEGYVEVDDEGTIVSVGKCDDFLSEKNIWDGAIIPGMVNAHCHVELSHLKGKFRKGSGMAGFIDQINALRDSSSRDEKIRRLSSEMDRMWKSGVSAMADISNCDDSFAVKAASPMYTRTFLEVFGSEPQDCAAVIEGAKALKKEAESYGLDASITPHACYTMSPQLVTASAAEGLSTGYLSYHSQESRQEEEMIASGTGEMAENRRRYGMSMPPVTGKSSLDYFIGRLLQVHPAPFDEHILLVHNVCLDETAAEAALSVMKNVFWAVCPLSNIFIHDTLPPVMLMRKLGLSICVGTDSLSSNYDLDMVKEMYCLQKNFPEVKTGEILSWACLNGARFLSREETLGSIAPGKRPGIVGIRDVDRNGALTASSCSVRLI